jgi:redox-sensitive bicupin YhaK (pirin superfamily)
MTTIRRAHERGHADHGWLNSFHTFSFADYYDPKHMGFRALRVINDDTVAAGRGFGTHGHRDMEIVSYVLSGELGHKDSMGNGSVIRPGDVQRMSAGTGVQHSEQNPSKTSPVHFLQIWIVPDRNGHAPGYEQTHFPEAERQGRLRLVASPDGADGSVSLHQDARLFAGLFAAGERAVHTVAPGRHAWIHVARGTATVDGHALGAGDALSTSDPGELVITGDRAEVLVFDLA